MTVSVCLVPTTIPFSDMHNIQLWTDDEMVSVAAKASLRKEMKVVLKGLTKEARWVVVDRQTQLICLKHTKEIARQSDRFCLSLCSILSSLSFSFLSCFVVSLVFFCCFTVVAIMVCFLSTFPCFMLSEQSSHKTW